MLTFNLSLTVLVFLSILLGFVLGLSVSRSVIRKHKPIEAPAPVDLGYDPLNPINQRNTVNGIAVGEVDPATGLVRIA